MPRVKKLCVIDIAPTLDMYNATDQRFATLLPLVPPDPADPAARDDDRPQRAAVPARKLGGWGSQGLGYIEPQALAITSVASAGPSPSTPRAGITAPAPALTWTTTAAVPVAASPACDLHVLWGARGGGA